MNTLFAGLTWLQLDRNTRITHTLAFVSIRLAKLVHLGCDLTQLLLVDTGQCQRRLVLLNTSLRRQTLSLRIDFRRKRKLDRVRITEREDDLLALRVGLVTDPDHVHLPGEAFGHPRDGVVGERTRQTVQRCLLVGSTL